MLVAGRNMDDDLHLDSVSSLFLLLTTTGPVPAFAWRISDIVTRE
jgi:hypothetical protein